jgi:hypothetical protein
MHLFSRSVLPTNAVHSEQWLMTEGSGDLSDMQGGSKCNKFWGIYQLSRGVKFTDDPNISLEQGNLQFRWKTQHAQVHHKLHLSCIETSIGMARRVQVNSPGNWNEFIQSEHSGISHDLLFHFPKPRISTRFTFTWKGGLIPSNNAVQTIQTSACCIQVNIQMKFIS